MRLVRCCSPSSTVPPSPVGLFSIANEFVSTIFLWNASVASLNSQFHLFWYVIYN